MKPFQRTTARKIYKTSLDEKGYVQCASLNKSSLNSFVTGHENGTIKLWKIGQEQCLNQFESNSAITCVAFNQNKNNEKSNDNLLISGNIGGGIKLYDLNENKLIRNYGGHRCEITDIDFFNFNDATTLIVSCSTDSNVKIWDTRSKTNILTLKGHTNTVNCIDFSPDGSWIVSADCIGHTKLWDIKTSKCIHQFHDKQPINDVLFHPEELVLATASGKVIRFWDLETMKHISRTSKGTTPINKILFTEMTQNQNENQQYIISASNQSLRIWEWDPLPVHCINNISVHWNNNIGDIKQIKGFNDLICLELDKHRVIVWLTDLGQVFGDDDNTLDDNTLDDNTYDDDEFEEIDDEDIPPPLEPNGYQSPSNAKIDVPNSLKNMKMEMFTQSFVDAVEIVREQRKIDKKKGISNVVSKSAFEAKTELKRSPLKNEGDDINTNLKLGQFIPRHLVDYDERELIKIKRTMMGQHIPTLKMLSTRLRYLRQLKSLWKKKKLNEFMEILQQIQNDTECGNNTIFISFIQSILENMNTKSFSFRFCYLLLSIINLDKLNIENANIIIVIFNFIHYFLETFSSLIIDTLKTEIINEKDLNMMDRRQFCQNAHDLLTKDIQLFIIKIQNLDKGDDNNQNIKRQELCEKNMTLIQLLIFDE